MSEKYGEFNFNGAHIDINKNVNHYDYAATFIHEMSHQKLAGNSNVGALDFLLMNIDEVTTDKSIKSKIKQLYKRVNNSSIRVQESTAMFEELAFLKAFSTEKYKEMMLHYRDNYYKKYRFNDLEFLLSKVSCSNDGLLVSEIVYEIAIAAMNPCINELDPLDGKYLCEMDKQIKNYNPNYRFSHIVKYIRENDIEIRSCDRKTIRAICAKENIPVCDFLWEKFSEWANNKIIVPLKLLSIETYIQYEKNPDPINNIISISAYNSSVANFKFHICKNFSEIEIGFMNSQVLLIVNNQKGTIDNFLINLFDRELYYFTTSTLFIKYFNEISIVMTDRNHYLDLVEIEPTLQSSCIFVDLAEMSPSLWEFLEKVNIMEYHVLELNETFDAICFKGDKGPIFFHMTSRMNTVILRNTYLIEYVVKEKWWEDVIPIEGLKVFKEFLVHQY